MYAAFGIKGTIMGFEHNFGAKGRLGSRNEQARLRARGMTAMIATGIPDRREVAMR